MKQICLDYATHLTESFRENDFNMEQTARSTGHHQIWRLLNGTQDTGRGCLRCTSRTSLEARSAVVFGLRSVCVVIKCVTITKLAAIAINEAYGSGSILTY